MNANTRWEFMKKHKRNSPGKNANERRLIISQLFEKIDDLQSQMPLTCEQQELLNNSQYDLEELQLQHIAGTMFRSKAKW